MRARVRVVACSDYSALSCVMKQAGPPLIKGTNRITNLGNRTEPQVQMASGQGEGKEREEEREKERIGINISLRGRCSSKSVSNLAY